MADSRIALGSLPRSYFGNVKVTSADCDTDGLGAAALANGSVTDAKLAAAARGRLKYTNAGGWGNLDVHAAGAIPVGDGTDVNAQTLSGDVTMDGTGAVTIAALAVTTAKLANAAVTGAKASNPLATKAPGTSVPTVATTGTTEQCLIMPFAGTVTAVRFVTKDALAQHASNYLTFAIVNKGSGGGSAAVLAATDANTTKTSTGSAISAYTTRSLALNGSPTVAVGDTLALQFISNATLANTLTEGYLEVDVLTTA